MMYNRCQIGVAAQLAFVFVAYQLGQRHLLEGDFEMFKESAKFFFVVQQVVIDGLTGGGELIPSGHFVVKEFLSPQGIAEGVVQLVGNQFIVFHQTVIGLLWEKQGREEQRVDK